ncbi:myo-inosose-2 dehydratase [Opitutaceae bacterium EW11]|nr:myo-inosose-2 dehydratase [Opitutaceae bacterium EW11]
MHSPKHSPKDLRDCWVGANPIIWSNDDFNELAGDVPLDAILRDMRAVGYSGTELGHAYPRTATALCPHLEKHQLRLVSGWHSTYLATRSLEQERASFAAHLRLLKPLGATVAIVAECSHAIHGDRNAALGYGVDDRRTLTSDEWTRLVAGLSELATTCASEGMKLVYHHHMGTVIQTEAELDRLLASVPNLHLVLDAGHLSFAGIDPHAVVSRHGDRIGHVHLKSTRASVVAQARREGWSFCKAVSSGVFTIPGDGEVDYVRLLRELSALPYRGWLVVEAEEDPGLVPALPKAKKAREFVRQHAGV